ncbi:hypothetical protein PLEOSDRAFT_1098257 [Pleurotus ostreatus PC15]|uniref:Uncharacterized protein n=1 Tax=Pleurotus ostreatus (strain PC15) TaxID=1137138 RepID=A0A067NEF4_PLEO1|nr:hypothetical protein PLEOSDRAFT_1098257 [Pleurotus ostreatus PC15]
MSTDDFQTETALSSKGNEYTITRPVGGEVVNSCSSSNSKENFGISVVWKPQGSAEWIHTPQEVHETAAITRYKLVQHETNSDGETLCTLHFTNTKSYGHHFFDQTGDKYWVSTWLKGNHSVDYKSKKPTIVFITGD